MADLLRHRVNELDAAVLEHLGAGDPDGFGGFLDGVEGAEKDFLSIYKVPRGERLATSLSFYATRERPSPRSICHGHVGHVFGMGANDKMVRVDADFCVAEMPDLGARRNVQAGEKERYPVRIDVSCDSIPGEPKCAIVPARTNRSIEQIASGIRVRVNQRLKKSPVNKPSPGDKLLAGHSAPFAAARENGAGSQLSRRDNPCPTAVTGAFPSSHIALVRPSFQDNQKAESLAGKARSVTRHIFPSSVSRSWYASLRIGSSDPAVCYDPTQRER